MTCGKHKTMSRYQGLGKIAAFYVQCDDTLPIIFFLTEANFRYDQVNVHPEYNFHVQKFKTSFYEV